MNIINYIHMRSNNNKIIKLGWNRDNEQICMNWFGTTKIYVKEIILLN